MDQNQIPGAYRPTPSYQQKLSLINANPQLPQKVDLNAVDPAYKEYYQAYNQTVDELAGTAANTQKQATLAQQDIEKAYGLATSGAETAYKSGISGVQQTNQDAQLANRLRARAMGGAPSSGFLDLANRTDVQSQRDVGALGGQLGQSYRQADLTASQGLSGVIADLNNALLDIQKQGNLTLRQRDAQIQAAKEAAAQKAAYLASLEDLYRTPDVLGTSTGGEEAIGEVSTSDLVPARTALERQQQLKDRPVASNQAAGFNTDLGYGPLTQEAVRYEQQRNAGQGNFLQDLLYVPTSAGVGLGELLRGLGIDLYGQRQGYGY